MLRFHLDPNSRILEIEPEGKLETKDFEAMASAVDPLIAEKGSLAGVLVKAKTFPGWQDFESFTTHMRFVNNHHEKVTRVAVVTDSKLLTFMEKLGKHFVSAQVRQFPSTAEAEARKWLTTP